MALDDDFKQRCHERRQSEEKHASKNSRANKRARTEARRDYDSFESTKIAIAKDKYD